MHWKYLITFIIFLFTIEKSYANVADVWSSAKDISSGIVKQAGEAIPKPNEIFELGKQGLLGLPLEVAVDAINKVCTAALTAKTISPKITPDIKKMNFQLMTPCTNYSFPLTEADKMWKSPQFDPKKKVVIFVTGWTNTINDSRPIQIMTKPYFCRNDVNFIIVDSANFVDTLYTWSAFNTEEIGKNIAVGLIKLIEIVPIEKVHLIGHSLGAHIVGYAGRYFNEKTGKFVPRITGLDPAKPCFNEGENLSGLLRGDALFIDIIHSNPGILGKRDPIGDVDFYPAGLTSIAPGTYSFTESHSRAVEYFAESAFPGNEQNFPAKRCTSLTRLQNGNCKGQDVFMGYDTPSHVKGNYFLDVNGETPYGMGNTKGSVTDMKCGECKPINGINTEQPKKLNLNFLKTLL